MTKYLPIILAAGILAFFITPLTRLLAQRVGMMDQPGLRKAHRSPVPLLGGLAMYAAVVLAFIAFGSLDWLKEGIGILGGATLLFLTGLWDDRYGLKAGLKFFLQLVATACLIAVGIQVQLFHQWWLDLPITFFWVVGITNAVNLMDNMDGLAAGVSAVAAVFFFALAALQGLGLVASLAAALLGSALGFLFYNFAPAVSFMGDAGALMLGFLLAALGIKIKFSGPVAGTWMVPIVILGVLIFDTTLVTFSRWRRRRSISQGGSDHTSHRLVQMGLSHQRAVLTIYLAAVALGMLAVYLSQASMLVANAAFAALVAVGIITLLILERVEPALTGDPPLVLIPGGGGFVEAVRVARSVSRDVTVLFAPRWTVAGVSPARLEVVETLTALADESEAARDLLMRGLSEEWWRDVNRLNLVLRLGGLALAVADPAPEILPAPDPAYTLSGEPEPEALKAIRRARLIVLGSGDPEVNLIPALLAPGMRAALREARAPKLCVAAETQRCATENWLGEPVTVVSMSVLHKEMQARLLKASAAQAKTQTG